MLASRGWWIVLLLLYPFLLLLFRHDHGDHTMSKLEQIGALEWVFSMLSMQAEPRNRLRADRFLRTVRPIDRPSGSPAHVRTLLAYGQ